MRIVTITHYSGIDAYDAVPIQQNTFNCDQPMRLIFGTTVPADAMQVSVVDTSSDTDAREWPLYIDYNGVSCGFVTSEQGAKCYDAITYWDTAGEFLEAIAEHVRKTHPEEYATWQPTPATPETNDDGTRPPTVPPDETNTTGPGT